MTAFLADYTLRVVMAGAMLAGALAGLAGSFALIRRQSLMGDTLAHAALPGVCLGFLVAGGRDLPALMAGALAAGMIAAAAATALSRLRRIKPDAALGITLSLAFALGLVLLTRIQSQGGAAGGIETFLFGQAAAMRAGDVGLLAALAALAAAGVAVAWRPIKATVFDRNHAAVLGVPVGAVDLGLTGLVALAVVAGVQVVGVVLMTALIVAPAAAARQWARSLGGMVTLSVAFGALAAGVGALVSAAGRGLSTGPVIVLAATALVLVSFLVAPERGALAVLARRARARERAARKRVLGSLDALARAHDDPAYPAERGMIEALHGRAARATLARLESEGLVRAVDHAPESTPHWALTEAGRAAARGAP
jgi:manganese/zinc/iron transport system permease protein